MPEERNVIEPIESHDHDLNEVAGGSIPPGQRGYEGQPGNQGGGGAPGQRGYEGQPGNQGGP